MPETTQVEEQQALNECTVTMRAEVKLEIGSVLNLVFSHEVNAGEPSRWQKVHAKYHGQNCRVVGINTRSVVKSIFRMEGEPTIFLRVKFDDGFEEEATARAFQYVGPPEKK